MFCTKCGAWIPAGDSFCTNCGAPVEPDNDAADASADPAAEVSPSGKQYGPPPAPEPNDENTRKQRRNLTFLLSGIALAAAGYLVVAAILPGTGRHRESLTGERLGRTGAVSLFRSMETVSIEMAGYTVRRTVDSSAAEGIALAEAAKIEAAAKEAARKKPADPPDRYYTYHGHTYAFYDATVYGLTSYSSAANFCRVQGGHLAVINDADENAFLFDTLQNRFDQTAFFGYSDEERESAWTWSDGDSTYLNWANDRYGQQPDNGSGYGGDEDYAEFAYERYTASANDGTWNDAPYLANTTRFICEWEYILTD